MPQKTGCFFQFLGSGGCHCFCMWQVPPPYSQLYHSLQCCSLLNYYQWVWRDTCSLFPLAISLMTESPTLSLTYTHVNSNTYSVAYISPDVEWADVVWKLTGTKTLQVSMLFTWIFTLDGNYTQTGTDLHTVMHEWTEDTKTQMLLCSLYK